MLNKLPLELVNKILEYDKRFLIHNGKISFRIESSDERYALLQAMFFNRKKYNLLVNRFNDNNFIKEYIRIIETRKYIKKNILYAKLKKTNRIKMNIVINELINKRSIFLL